MALKQGLQSSITPNDPVSTDFSKICSPDWGVGGRRRRRQAHTIEHDGRRATTLEASALSASVDMMGPDLRDPALSEIF